MACKTMLRLGWALAVLGAATAAAQDTYPSQDPYGGLFIQLTLPEVLEKHYDAIGGLDDWDEVETMTLTGEMTVQVGADAPFTQYLKRPDKVRLEFVFQGVTGIQAFDGETGWTLLPFAGQTEAQPMPEEAVAQLRGMADFDSPLMHWEEKEYLLELVSHEEVGGFPVYKIKATLGEGGEELHYFINSTTFLLERIEGRTQWEGAPAEFEVLLSNYRDIGKGLKLAHEIRQQIKGQPGGPTITIEEVELDTELPDSLFAMPATAPAAAPPATEPGG